VHDLLRTRFPADRGEVLATLRMAGSWDGLLRHQTRDSGEVVTWSRWSAVRDPAGRIISVLETNRDVTEQRREMESLRSRVVQLQAAVERHELEQSVLREDGARWRAIVDAAMDAIISVDEDQRIATMNPAATALLGIEERDGVGQPADRFLPPRKPDRGTPAPNSTVSGRDIQEFAVRRADGTDISVQMVSVRVPIAGRQQMTHIIRPAV
jgi:PAS domain S-box-containing protein